MTIYVVMGYWDESYAESDTWMVKAFFDPVLAGAFRDDCQKFSDAVRQRCGVRRVNPREWRDGPDQAWLARFNPWQFPAYSIERVAALVEQGR